MINYQFREEVLLLSLSHCCPHVNFVTDPVQGTQTIMLSPVSQFVKLYFVLSIA